MVNIYTKKGRAYTMDTFIFNEISRLQYKVLKGCSTIWQKYGVIIGNLQMFISVTMEMEKLYSSDRLLCTSFTCSRRGTYMPWKVLGI